MESQADFPERQEDFMSWLTTVLAISAVVQFSAAVLALLQFRKTGRIGAWILLAVAFCLMGCRHLLTLTAISGGTAGFALLSEVVAFLASLFVLAGVWRIQDAFARQNRLRVNAEELAERCRAPEAALRQVDEMAACLREHDEQLRFLGDNLPGGLLYQIDTGVDGQARQFTYVSRGVEQLHELSVAEVMKMPFGIYSQLEPEDRGPYADRERQALATESPFNAEVRVNLPSGRQKWLLIASAPRRLPNRHLVWDGIEIDITERKRFEEEQRRRQALESLGLVAGGIAHDFNNLLTSIFGNMELAQMDLPRDHPAQARLRVALQSTNHATRLTARLLTFAKGGQPVLKTLDLRKMLHDTVQFNLAGSSIAVRFDVADALWCVKADAGQFAQVFANIVINAREAMPQGGTLTVQARNVPGMQGSAPPTLRGDFVGISIHDEGAGIPDGIIGQIFNPYFTTKQKGSGLGLAIAHGIVHKHNGQIQVECPPSGGTTFTVLLPAAADAPAPGVVPGAGPGCSMAASRATGHVLVMDDEPAIRMVSAGMLTHLGFTSETVADGREALKRYQAAMQRGRPFDAVILDLTVPGGMGGIEAVRGLLDLDPSARVIVASGYSSDAVFAEYGGHGFCGCLTKPFELSRLQEALSQCKGRQERQRDVGGPPDHRA
jgi:PAS domain S-box-containing protein